MLSLVLDLSKSFAKISPRNIGTQFFSDFVHAISKEFFLLDLCFGVEVPIKHLSQKISLVLGFLDDSMEVAFVTHKGDVSNIFADLLGQERVHPLCVVKA